MGHFLRKNWLRRGVAVLAAVATLGTVGTASAITIGHGVYVDPGGNTGVGPKDDLLWLHDQLNNGNPEEGWGDASTTWMLNNLVTHGVNFSTDSQNRIRTACRNAINDAIARSGRAKRARVVGLVATIGTGRSGKPVLWGDNREDFRARFQKNWNSWGGPMGGPTGELRKWSNDDINKLHDNANQAIDGMSGVMNQAVCLAVNEFEPASLRQQYHLNVHTTSQNAPKKAGDANPVHDRIVATLNRGEQWSGGKVNLGVWLNWDGYPAGASRNAIRKQATISGPSTVNSPDFTPSDFGWKTWAPGRYWFDISSGKQGNMAGGVNTSDRQASETFNLEPSTNKELTRMNGQKMDGQLAPGTQYMAHVTGTVTPAINGKYNTRATITDHILSKNVWVGANDHDDLTKVTVSHDGRTVTNGVHVTKTDTADGYDVTATITNPAEGEYTLNIPSTIKALTGNGKDKTNETIKDQGCIIPNTGARQVCSDTKQEQGEHPETSKAWQLKDGKLIEDKDWTNHVGADGMTFLPGDPVSASQLNSQPMVHRNHAVFRQTKGSAQESRDPAEPLLFA